MKNEKMFAKLLTLLFLVSLTFNLFAQEKSKKEQKVVVKTISKKDGKKLEWTEKEDSSNVVWVVKGDGFEWDTTFTIEDDNDLDIDAFLKKRFPEMDTMKNKNINISMDGNRRRLKFSSGAHHDKLIELQNNIFIDEDGESIEFHIEKMDSLMSKNKILNSYVISGDVSSKLKVLNENLDGLKYEILTTIDEDDNEHTVHLEVLKNIGENMKDFEFIINDGDKSKLKNIYELHSNELHCGLVIDDELKQEDIDFLKKSGVKIGAKKLDLNKLFFYNDEDDFMNLKFKLKTEGKATIRIINETGEDVFVDKVQYFPGTYDKQTKLSMENKGVYYIIIEQNAQSNAYKIDLN